MVGFNNDAMPTDTDRCLSNEVLNKIFATSSSWFHTFLNFAFYTGANQRNIYATRFSLYLIDLDRKKVTYRHQMNKRKQ